MEHMFNEINISTLQ